MIHKTIPEGEDPLVNMADFEPRIVLDIRYATTNNFTGKQLYVEPRCFLRKSVAERLKNVANELEKQKLRLKIYDGYRPNAVQWELWKIVSQPGYVADPRKGSRHNRGAAVDCTLIDSHGQELEMPTGFDSFTTQAHRDATNLSQAALKNRHLLQTVMEANGFVGLPTEWWHFDAVDWEKFSLLDIPLESLP